MRRCVNRISGMGSQFLKSRKHGPSVLHRKPNIRADGAMRQRIVSEFEKNPLTLVEASLKYGVSTSRLKIWLRKAREPGMEQSVSRKGNCLDNAVMENFLEL